MNPDSNQIAQSIALSIGIIAWNEEAAIGRCLESLFAQSLFAHCAALGLGVEIVGITNGCTDATPEIVRNIFADQSGSHQHRRAFSCRPIDVSERGKLRAWNAFVHELSAQEVSMLILMDGDIVLQHPDTLWNMISVLSNDSEAWVSTDEPLKDISLGPKNSLRERISLATSKMSQASEAQLTGQLYCIRAEIARRIYLPRDLPACEDGFIKTLVCTDFLTKPTNPRRIVRAKNATHIFEAYLSVADVLRNQKRQMIGQTFLHVLHSYLGTISLAQRQSLAEILRQQDEIDAGWLLRLVQDHLQRTGFWGEIFPGVFEFRFQRLARLRGVERWTHAPAAMIGFGVTMIACIAARHGLQRGAAQYWPDTKSRHLQSVATNE